MKFNKPSPKALNLILKYEVGGGQSYYEKYLSRFTWPGGSSGPTIGIGIDVAYYSAQELASIFEFLSKEHIGLIQEGSGKTSQQGKEYASKLRKADIMVNWAQAIDIFEKLTWPKFASAAERTFPDLNKLHEDAYGAIVSIVFNRGTNLKGDTRKEMRAIKDLIPQKNYKDIAKQVRGMKRLWKGKNLDGLIERRESEALLIESVI